MVPADSRRISRVPRYSGACLFNILRISPKGLSPALARLSSRFGYPGYQIYRQVLQPRMMRCHISGLGSLRVRSPLLAESLLFSFPPGTEMFQFPGFASAHTADTGIASGGLPHSEIRGSMGICPSPRLIAACHVLLRLREPRHPSCALVSFPWCLLT